MTRAQIDWTAAYVAMLFYEARTRTGRDPDSGDAARDYYTKAIGVMVAWHTYFRGFPAGAGKAAWDSSEWLRKCQIPPEIRQSRVWARLIGDPARYTPDP